MTDVSKRPRTEIEYAVVRENAIHKGILIHKGVLIIMHDEEDGEFLARVDDVTYYPAFHDYKAHKIVSYHKVYDSSKRGGTPHLDKIRPYNDACPHCHGTGMNSLKLSGNIK